jgi:hypothetical protein
MSPLYLYSQQFSSFGIVGGHFFSLLFEADAGASRLTTLSLSQQQFG